MEDPWANAWGETSKATISDSSVLASGSSTWSAPSVSAIHGDNEDDLSTSSWSVQATPHWNDTDPVETSIWTNDAPSTWVPTSSTFDRISLSGDFPSEPAAHFPTSPSEDVELPPSPNNHSVSIEPENYRHPASPDVKPSETPPRTPLPPTLVLDEDIDAFGTFETGEVADDSGEWTPPRLNFNLPSAEVAALAPRWDYPSSAATDATHDTMKELDDAWDKAREAREKQDRYVPRELLASILRQVEELSDDLWPVPDSENGSLTEQPRRMDMEDLGLNSVIQRLAPDDLTLPPKQPFHKTFTSKQSSEAVKLTRHSPLTKLSPMGFYLSSKGLTSWEASVKAKPNITPDDFTPPGWKIVESPKVETQAPEDTKKSSGGLLSFFGRKSTMSSSDVPTIGRPASPALASGIFSVKASSSPRPSVDSSRPGSTPIESKGQSSTSSPVVAHAAAVPGDPVAKHTKSLSVSEKPPIVTVVALDSIKRETTPPPSAVSRFFGRFSRHKSSSSRDSLALSADDLEFLSDVPTIETKEEVGNELDALSRMIKSSPLPTALPPPLPPPPRLPSQPSRMSSMASRAGHNENKQEDFLSLFEDVSTQSVPPAPPTSMLAPLPTPPVKSTFLNVSTSSTASISSSRPNSSASNPRSANVSPPPKHTSPVDQLWPSFDYPSAPMNQNTQSKRATVATISSAPTSSSAVPPLLPKPLAGFSLPPPPSSSRSRAVSPNPSLVVRSGHTISPLPPPSSSRSHTPSVQSHQVQPQPALASFDEDDDFADFLSSPAQTTNPSQVAFADFETPASSLAHQMPVNTHVTPSNDIFSGFENLDNPPRPPAKPLNVTVGPSNPPNPPSKSKSPPPPLSSATRRTSRAADHSRTLSLMESAAARGRWLGPPSPLPEALPPPSTTNGNASSMDPFEGGSSMQAQQARATAALSAPPASIRASNGSLNQRPAWNFAPPMNPTLLEPVPSPPSHKAQSLLPVITPNTTAASTPNTTRTGGLSAQDLSFFEGL